MALGGKGLILSLGIPILEACNYANDNSGLRRSWIQPKMRKLSLEAYLSDLGTLIPSFDLFQGGGVMETRLAEELLGPLPSL